jgi:prefoldin subunit 5
MEQPLTDHARENKQAGSDPQDETTRLQAIRHYRKFCEMVAKERAAGIVIETTDEWWGEIAETLLAVEQSASVLEAARQEIATLTELAYHRQSGGRTWKDVATVALYDHASAEAQGDALRQQIATLQAQVDALTRAQANTGAAPGTPERIAEIREYLWIHHGHQGVYGDDGERQCGQCAPTWDYKRAPLEQVALAAFKAMQAQVATLTSDLAQARAERVTVDALRAALRKAKEAAEGDCCYGGSCVAGDVVAIVDAVLLDERGSR